MSFSKNQCPDKVGGLREPGLRSTELVNHRVVLAHHLDLWLLSCPLGHGGES
jgi:hypothetical protein